jgi:hypothetical protein
MTGLRDEQYRDFNCAKSRWQQSPWRRTWLCNDAAQHWRNLMEQIFNPYRPELHYVRGPRPKWHAKHAAKIVHD